MDAGLIIDLGMHIGQDTAYYLKKGFRVVSVEADPILAKEGEVKFSEDIAAGRLKIMNCGVGDKEGTFPFYINALHSSWSSFNQEIGSRGGCKEVINVPMVPLKNIIDEVGVPYYIKVDIEGYDFIAIQGLRGLPSLPRFVSVENGQLHMLRYLVELGYNQFKFINQAKVPEVRLPAQQREGDSIEWTFISSSSGPFGEDTPGDWLDEASVSKLISAYWDNPARDANIHGWFDLHAKLG